MTAQEKFEARMEELATRAERLDAVIGAAKEWRDWMRANRVGRSDDCLLEHEAKLWDAVMSLDPSTSGPRSGVFHK